ncbi:MAG: transposase [Conexivisphaerales archaeon]
MEKGRSVFSLDDKMRIALESLRGMIHVYDLCRKYGISPVTFYYRKSELLNSSSDIFKSRGRKKQMDSMIEMDEETYRLMSTIP